MNSRLNLFQRTLYGEQMKDMKKGISYSIAEPCHENWNAMIPEEKGRFCNSCQKTVVDFSRMSLPDIHQFMQQVEGSVCGRMSPNQLNTPVFTQQPTENYWFSLRALVLGTALSTFSAIQAHAQGKVRPVKGKVAVSETPLLGQMESATTCTQPKDSVFSGKVVDYLNDRFPAGVAVTIYDAEGNELATTLSNNDGEFKIPLLENWVPYKAVFRKEELPESIFYFDGVTSTVGIVIEMTEEAEFKMGIVIRLDD